MIWNSGWRTNRHSLGRRTSLPEKREWTPTVEVRMYLIRKEVPLAMIFNFNNQINWKNTLMVKSSSSMTLGIFSVKRRTGISQHSRTAWRINWWERILPRHISNQRGKLKNLKQIKMERNILAGRYMISPAIKHLRNWSRLKKRSIPCWCHHDARPRRIIKHLKNQSRAIQEHI